VASAGELVIARAAGFTPERIVITGPDKSPAVLKLLRYVPEALLSLDSVSELHLLSSEGFSHRALLRLRPDFCSMAQCAAGPDSRFGLLFDDLTACRDALASGGIRVIGFHVFAGSQVLDAGAVCHHLRGAVELSLRAADVLGFTPEIIDLGGGFGIPYGPEDCELDLAVVAEEVRSLLKRAAPARFVFELGRYVIAQAGWYLTTVLAQQRHGGRPAVVVDGGSHQRADMCGIGLRHRAVPPVVIKDRSQGMQPLGLGMQPLGLTDVLGCLSLPADVLAEARPLPRLVPGDVLAFPNAGAYGLGASPSSFHAHPALAEVAFDGTQLELLRARQPIESVLEGQVCLGHAGRRCQR
jgi:diaminopimelate decarboxylase